MGIVRHEDPLPFPRVFLFKLVCQRRNPFPVFFKRIPQIGEDQLIGQMVLFARIHKSPDPAGCRLAVRHIRVYMDDDIASALAKEARRLDSAHVIVCVDAGDKLVFTLDADHRHPVGSQLSGRDCPAQDDHAFDIVGKQLFNVFPLHICFFIPGEDKELVAVSPVSVKDLAEHF